VQHYTFLASVILGAAIASRKGLHVRVEVLDTLLKDRPKPRLAIRTSMLVVAFVSVVTFTYFAFEFMIWAWDIKQTDTILTWFNLGFVKTLPFIMGLVSSVAVGWYLFKSYTELKSAPNADGEKP